MRALIVTLVAGLFVSCSNDNGKQERKLSGVGGIWIPREVNWQGEADFSTYYFVDDSTAVVLSSVQKNLHDSIYFATESGFNIKKGVVRPMSDGRFSIIGKTIYRFIQMDGPDQAFQDTVVVGEGSQSMMINSVDYIQGDRYTRESKQRIRDIATKMVPDIERHPEGFGQATAFSEQYDSVIYEKVQINGVPMSGDKKDILSKIGKPQKITKFVSDATTDHWFEYRYGRTILQVADDGRFWGFELKTTAFTWRYGADSVKVGDPLSLLCNHFPASCRTMKREKGEIVRVRCQGSDGFIHFWVKDNVVISIETWQDI